MHTFLNNTARLSGCMAERTGPSEDVRPEKGVEVVGLSVSGGVSSFLNGGGDHWLTHNLEQTHPSNVDI